MLAGCTWVIYTIDKIITNIFDWEGIDYSIPEYEFAAPSGRKRKNRPFSFVLKENNRNIGYVFLYNLHKGLIEIRKNARKFNGIDSVRYYFLQRDNKKYIDQLNDLERKDDGSFLEFYSIKEFFDEKFGNDEFPIFMNYVDRFNERARNLIGFKTISIPTKDTVKTFKRSG